MQFYTVNKDDELYHWKYIKKTKVNGKWRYYYDEMKKDLGVNVKDKLDMTKKQVGITLQNTNYRQDKVEKAKQYLEESKNASTRIQSYAQYDYEKQLGKRKLQSITNFMYKTKYNSLLAKYKKTPIGKIYKDY